MGHATFDGAYVGCEPGTKNLYVERNRPGAPGAWEALTATKHEQWYSLLLDSAQVQLCLNKQTRKLEVRKKGDVDEWGGQWVIPPDGRTATIADEQVTVTLVLIGVKLTSSGGPGGSGGSALTALRIVDRDFVDANGQRHTIIGSTELLLARRYDLEGADAIRPTLQERHDIGFNNLRCLLSKDFNNSGQPWKMPIKKLRPFHALAAEYGFYIQDTILADCQVVLPTVAEQQRFVADVRAETVGVPNLLEQLGNEADKNGHDPRNFIRPTDRLAANSSTTSSGVGKDHPYWDFFCFSGARSPLNTWIRENGPVEFMYSTSADGKPWGGVPAICDESAKPGVHPAGDYTPRDWERAGAQARSGCGGRFHSLTGTGDKNQPQIIPSGLFTAFERECAVAFVKGLKG